MARTFSPAKQLARRLASAQASVITPEALAAKQDLLTSGANIKSINGQSVLGSGNLTISGGAVLSGSGTLTLASSRIEHQQTITATGVTGSSRIFVAVQAGADTDENTADMLDMMTLAGAPGTDQITITATFREPTSGPVLIYWSAA